MKKREEIFLLVFLVFLLILINYSLIDKKLSGALIESNKGFVERVIDGDTIVVNNESVRLLGINSPEKGDAYYWEAKEFLESRVLGKEVVLEFGKEKYDIYDRILAYVFLEGENINLELVEAGFGNFYFPSGKDKYFSGFKAAWERCIQEDENLCERSRISCSNCIKLKNLDFIDEEIEFYNKCTFNCNLTFWEIKDEGRKVFVFPEFILEGEEGVEIFVDEGINTNKRLFWNRSDYVWTDTGDTLFLRDNEGKLVLWDNY